MPDMTLFVILEFGRDPIVAADPDAPTSSGYRRIDAFHRRPLHRFLPSLPPKASPGSGRRRRPEPVLRQLAVGARTARADYSRLDTLKLADCDLHLMLPSVPRWAVELDGSHKLRAAGPYHSGGRIWCFPWPFQP